MSDKNGETSLPPFFSKSPPPFNDELENSIEDFASKNLNLSTSSNDSSLSLPKLNSSLFDTEVKKEDIKYPDLKNHENSKLEPIQLSTHDNLNKLKSLDDAWDAFNFDNKSGQNEAEFKVDDDINDSIHKDSPVISFNNPDSFDESSWADFDQILPNKNAKSELKEDNFFTDLNQNTVNDNQNDNFNQTKTDNEIKFDNITSI